MSRDDSALYTGLTSSSLLSPNAKSLADKREEERIEREFDRKSLAPYMAIVSDAFKTELDQLTKIDYGNLNEDLSPEQFKADMLLNKKVVEAVKRIEQRINNKLRTH